MTEKADTADIEAEIARIKEEIIRSRAEYDKLVIKNEKSERSNLFQERINVLLEWLEKAMKVALYCCRILAPLVFIHGIYYFDRSSTANWRYVFAYVAFWLLMLGYFENYERWVRELPEKPIRFAPVQPG